MAFCAAGESRQGAAPRANGRRFLPLFPAMPAPHRDPEDLCEGATPALLEALLPRAIEYWSNIGCLIPDLDQVYALHQTAFHGYLRPEVAGHKKRLVVTVDGLLLTAPEDVERDYEELRQNAQVLLDRMMPPPVDAPNRTIRWTGRRRAIIKPGCSARSSSPGFTGG